MSKDSAQKIRIDPRLRKPSLPPSVAAFIEETAQRSTSRSIVLLPIEDYEPDPSRTETIHLYIHTDRLCAAIPELTANHYILSPFLPGELETAKISRATLARWIWLPPIDSSPFEEGPTRICFHNIGTNRADSKPLENRFFFETLSSIDAFECLPASDHYTDTGDSLLDEHHTIARIQKRNAIPFSFEPTQGSPLRYLPFCAFIDDQPPDSPLRLGALDKSDNLSKHSPKQKLRPFTTALLGFSKNRTEIKTPIYGYSIASLVEKIVEYLSGTLEICEAWELIAFPKYREAPPPRWAADTINNVEEWENRALVKTENRFDRFIGNKKSYTLFHTYLYNLIHNLKSSRLTEDLVRHALEAYASWFPYLAKNHIWHSEFAGIFFVAPSWLEIARDRVESDLRKGAAYANPFEGYLHQFAYALWHYKPANLTSESLHSLARACIELHEHSLENGPKLWGLHFESVKSKATLNSIEDALSITESMIAQDAGIMNGFARVACELADRISTDDITTWVKRDLESNRLTTSGAITVLTTLSTKGRFEQAKELATSFYAALPDASGLYTRVALLMISQKRWEALFLASSEDEIQYFRFALNLLQNDLGNSHESPLTLNLALKCMLSLGDTKKAMDLVLTKNLPPELRQSAASQFWFFGLMEEAKALLAPQPVSIIGEPGVHSDTLLRNACMGLSLGFHSYARSSFSELHRLYPTLTSRHASLLPINQFAAVAFAASLTGFSTTADQMNQLSRIADPQYGIVKRAYDRILERSENCAGIAIPEIERFDLENAGTPL